MPIKRYESKFHEEFVIMKLPSGKVQRIAFTGGGRYPKPHGGVFVTDDATMQEAIESRQDFNKRWKLTSTVYTRAEQERQGNEFLEKLKPKPAPVIPVKVPEKQPVKQTIPLLEIPEEPTHKKIVVSEVVNFQQAKTYLLKNYPGEATFKDLMSKASVQTMAKEKNIEFPNWKIE